MLTVLWIAVVGAALLFMALGGLVGLMYLLTAPWLFPSGSGPAPRVRRRKRRHGFRTRATDIEPPLAPASDGAVDAAEQERRRRAAALAVAIACAEDSQTAFVPADTTADWRLLHRARRLGGAAARRKARL